jgi:hypothetical protein
MTMTAGHRDNPSVWITSVAFVLIASTGALRAAGWDSIPSASDAVTVESFGLSKRMTRASGAWVLYAPTLSVDCSPPRGCYARTQRIHYDFSCSPRYALMTERISMDLNGTIVKHEVLDAAASYPASYDAAAVRVLDTFCPIPSRD